MGYEDFRSSVADRLRDNWTTTAISYEQIEYTPTPGTAFVALQFIPGTGSQTSIPAGYRYYDMFQVNIYYPAKSGTKTISEYADSIIDIYLGQKFDGITVYEVDSYKREIEEWLQWSVRFQCFRDET